MSAAPASVDQRMMKRALRLARKGRPSPNPHVGAVVVADGEVVGTGHHRRAGLAHAEVAALEQAGERARGATLYVTFEPCNHHGRTGPCTDAILEAGIARVVIGCRDPAPHVPGAIERLQQAGIEVEVGVLGAQAKELIEDFTKHITTGLPWVTVKAAVTLDGCMATRTGDSKWITGEEARRHAHRLRKGSDAVLIGVGTVLVDDPELTVRHVRGTDPMRVVVDRWLRTPPKAALVSTRSRARTVIFHGADIDPSRREPLTSAGAELVQVPGDGAMISLPAVLRELGRRNVVRLLVEGGPHVHGGLLREGLADAAAIFVAPRIVGDQQALPLALVGPATELAATWRLDPTRVRRLGRDVLFEGKVVRGLPA